MEELQPGTMVVVDMAEDATDPPSFCKPQRPGFIGTIMRVHTRTPIWPDGTGVTYSVAFPTDGGGPCQFGVHEKYIIAIVTQTDGED